MVDLHQEGGGRLISKMKELLALREREIGRRIYQNEISRATKLNPNTITRWMSPEPFTRIEAPVIIPLCRYFSCRVGDLLEIDYD